MINVPGLSRLAHDLRRAQTLINPPAQRTLPAPARATADRSEPGPLIPRRGVPGVLVVMDRPEEPREEPREETQEERACDHYKQSFVGRT